MGSEYWGGLMDWIKKTMLPEGKISEEDLDLIQVIDEPDQVVRHIQKFVIL
jgi:predicted Rossmann-fold nucleotide-binding protein